MRGRGMGDGGREEGVRGRDEEGNGGGGKEERGMEEGVEMRGEKGGRKGR